MTKKFQYILTETFQSCYEVEAKSECEIMDPGFHWGAEIPKWRRLINYEKTYISEVKEEE